MLTFSTSGKSRQARASPSALSATTRTCVLSIYKLMQETIAVGRAAGVEFSPDFQAELRSVCGGLSPNDEGLDGERP
jgi:hypothetical protein